MRSGRAPPFPSFPIRLEALANTCRFLQYDLQTFFWHSTNIVDVFRRFLIKCRVWSSAKVRQSCRAWKLLQHAYYDLLAKIGFDTAENELSKNLQHDFANFCPPLLFPYIARKLQPPRTRSGSASTPSSRASRSCCGSWTCCSSLRILDYSNQCVLMTGGRSGNLCGSFKNLKKGNFIM